jgi:thymidylate kinase
MVESIDVVEPVKIYTQSKGMIVELVGVAGAGKSTLFNELHQKRVTGLVNATVPPVWKLSMIPFFTKNIITLSPILFYLFFHDRKFLKRHQIAFMVLLSNWHKLLVKQITANNKIILLDQGPISMITDLLVWGPSSISSPFMEKWWEDVYKKWKNNLNMVFLLDASDETIIWRIRNRKKLHHLKTTTDEVSMEWINQYRRISEYIIAKLNSPDALIEVVRINSGENSIDEIVKIFQQKLNLCDEI